AISSPSTTPVLFVPEESDMLVTPDTNMFSRG
ncbi:MAG: hypothetical protein ACI8VW_000975, partial [bacterium]